jgi:hypothetical protein
VRASPDTDTAPVYQSLDDGHLRLFELLLGVTAGGVGEVDSIARLDVVRQGDVFYFDTGNKKNNKWVRLVPPGGITTGLTLECPTFRRVLFPGRAWRCPWGGSWPTF